MSRDEESIAPEAVISRTLSKLLHDATGRGPGRAWTTIGSDHVLVILEESLTVADRTLIADGRPDDVQRVRMAIQESLRGPAIACVAAATRREVLAFMSANSLDPDLAAEVFVLGPASPDAGEATV